VKHNKYPLWTMGNFVKIDVLIMS